MLILAVYPFIILLMFALNVFARQNPLQKSISAFTQLGLFLLFIMPWGLILTTIIKGNYPDISIGSSQLTKNADLWLLSCQAMLALVLLLIKNSVSSREAWLKSLLSYFIGILFLQLSLHPATGIGMVISTEVAQCIASVSFIIGIFLLFGLPPLQLGTIDLGSEKNPSLNLFVNVLVRFALAFVILFAMSFANWLGDISSLHGLIVGSIFLAVALSRLVLRLQTNVYRTFSYLSSGLALPVAAKLLFPEFSDLYLFVQVLFLFPLLMIFYDQPKNDSTGQHRLNWASLRHYHEEAAGRLHRGLKAFLYIECAAGLAFSASLMLRTHWGAAICVVFASFSALVVTQDKQAFAPQTST